MVSEILGVSGRAILKEIIAAYSDPVKLVSHGRGRLKKNIPELTRALEGKVSQHHRFMLELLWDRLCPLESWMERLDRKIDEQIAPFEGAVELMDEIPGIDRCIAQSILAEIGTDMSRYPSHKHLSSWAGMCPGNNESAGKHKSGKTTKGSRWLKRSLVQAAWAASHAKGSYFAAHYARLAGRPGRKRALVAVGHSILVAVYYMLKPNEPYQDLGADYFNNLNHESLTMYLVKRLQALGHKGNPEPNTQAA